MRTACDPTQQQAVTVRSRSSLVVVGDTAHKKMQSVLRRISVSSIELQRLIKLPHISSDSEKQARIKRPQRT